MGAGPAGLACAAELRRLGDAVVLFDAKDKAGGLNTFGIAEYKMTADLALREVELVEKLGVELRLKAPVGGEGALSFAKLLAEFDAVFIGVGLPRAVRLGVPGEDLPGVRQSADFIEELKAKATLDASASGLSPSAGKAGFLRDVRVGRRVAVIGGGNTAVDAATQAKRLGAERVLMIYRRGLAEMSAFHYEIELLRADGCELVLHAAPVRIEGEGRVERLLCQRVELTEADRDGRRHPRNVPGTDFALDVDMVIAAVGQRLEEGPLAKVPGLDFSAGHIAVDPKTFRTGHPKVWAAGDCANGGAEVVNAVAEGRDAGRSIHARPERITPHGRPVDIDFCGIKSPNPFWLASAPPTNTGDQVMRAFDAGWGGAVWKTIGDPIVNVSSRYGGLDVGGAKMVGFNNIELITDRTAGDEPPRDRARSRSATPSTRSSPP